MLHSHFSIDMNLIYIILFCQFVFIHGCKRMDFRAIHDIKFKTVNEKIDRTFPVKIPMPLSRVRMGITSGGKVIARINLKHTQRALANENLPVWILKGVIDDGSMFEAADNELERNYEVMNKIGRFITYHEPETTSAVIYFMNRQEFEGIINYGYAIEKLSVYAVHQDEETFYELNESDVINMLFNTEHININQTRWITDPTAGVNKQRCMKTYGGRMYDGYPEILVIISWEVANELIQNVGQSDWYSTIVSYILKTFNAVDMLYAKLQNTKIQINLAGIIIGTQKESFKFLNKCIGSVVRNGKHIGGFIATCINNQWREFLTAREKTFPFNSYDMILFLTKWNLYHKKMVIKNNTRVENYVPADGVSSCRYRLFGDRQNHQEVILVGSIKYWKSRSIYSVIAHEIAHLMTVMHDMPPFFTDDEKCCGNIMKICSDRCAKCTSWSNTSEESFKLFFSSPNCCAFINKPRSLHPPGRYKMLTADEQCQCDGFKESAKFVEVFGGFCYSDLICERIDGNFEIAGYPMDGTPCDMDKVCWQKSCEPVTVFDVFNL